MKLEVAQSFVRDLEREYDRQDRMGQVIQPKLLKDLDYYRTIVLSYGKRVQVKGGYMENGKVTLV